MCVLVQNIRRRAGGEERDLRRGEGLLEGIDGGVACVLEKAEGGVG